MDERKLSDTDLARWLNRKMAEWRDPETERGGLSTYGLAQQVGCAQSLIWKILKQGAIPKPEILIALAEFFDTSPMALFRLVYLAEEGEGEGQLAPGVENELMELESILRDVPVSAQAHLMRSLLAQAHVLKAATEAAQESAPAKKGGPRK